MRKTAEFSVSDTGDPLILTCLLLGFFAVTIDYCNLNPNSLDQDQISTVPLEQSDQDLNCLLIISCIMARKGTVNITGFTDHTGYSGQTAITGSRCHDGGF